MLTGSGLDLESQQTVLLTPRNPPRERWRAVFLRLHERNLIHTADDRGSLAFLRSLSSRTSYYSTFTSFDDDTREADIVEILTESPQSVNLNGENDNCIRDEKVQLQQAHIAELVKKKKLDSIHEFGGIQVIAEALGTNLETGIIPADVRSRCIACTPSTTQTSALGFLQFLPKSCNNCTILLLFMCAVLSLGFGVKAEGLRTGWYEGVIIILAIIILVVIDSLRNQRQLKHSQRMSEKHKPFELQRMMVDVIRGGCSHKVNIGDVLIGDLVRLERGYIVPADGLFIDGESLKLDDDLESTINEENPFLFYGAKVIDGKGRMLVASVGMNTRLGDLMKQVTHVPEKTPLPSQIDKVNKGTQIFGLSISILILVVLFLRFMLLKEEIKSSHQDLKGKPKAIKEIMDSIEKVVMKPNGKISTLTTSLATLLVGVMEGIPFVITLAISYWNKKMMSEDSEQAFAREPFACLTMSSVTSICIDTTGWCMPTQNPVPVGWEIRAFQNAGFNITLVSEDNVSVLETIALNCGLLPCSNAMVLEGEEFRKFSNEERMNKVDQIILIGSSIPSDQLTLVQCLKNKGHIVAMVGVKTNAIPALKEADVGITMRICSTYMARASSGIIIGDGNLSFLFTIFRFGRCTFENIQKYIQLELTMNIAGLLITSITAMFCRYSPITSIQLLWANFVVSLLGGIGILTEPPTEELMEKLPLKQTKPLITKAMWRNIVSQALYQVTISVAFQFKGQTIPGISNKVSKTIIFNSFVLCQVFNQVNARELEKKNVFKSIHRNPLFWVSVGVILILQVAFIEIAHIIVGNARLNWVQWFSCLLAGMVSWASDWVTKSTAELWNYLTRLLGSHLRTINIPRNSTSSLELPLTHP
ncbi:putative calcium-transporting ATPase 13, plasma membrane-type isoform X2 [Quercus lobata]|uniref:putative calcium-transporting ATPase 13, plasma membrane-type isoform X2 n=1 Tax=Quercus lobata TaxID=97700 RepID=UPI001247AE52|nr:putative calcium-transporting ATPase 13, plasma membrane-type isoform X2 [Quercus lobata]